RSPAEWRSRSVSCVEVQSWRDGVGLLFDEFPAIEKAERTDDLLKGFKFSLGCSGSLFVHRDRQDERDALARVQIDHVLEKRIFDEKELREGAIAGMGDGNVLENHASVLLAVTIHVRLEVAHCVLVRLAADPNPD